MASAAGPLPARYLPAALTALVPRGLEPRTLRLLAVRSNQLSYETSWCFVRDGQLSEKSCALGAAGLEHATER